MIRGYFKDHDNHNIASLLDDLLPANSVDPLQCVKCNAIFLLNPIAIHECSTLMKNFRFTKQDINKVSVDLFIM